MFIVRHLCVHGNTDFTASIKLDLAKNADWEKSAVIVRNLDALRDKVRALEKTIQALTAQDKNK